MESAVEDEEAAPGQPDGAQSDDMQIDQLVGHLLRACQQVHVALWSETFPAGLTSPQFAVLHSLARHGPLRQTTLRSMARLDRSNAADVIRRLVSRRLVTQVRDPADARRKVVRLTAAGSAVHREAAQRARQVNDAMFDGLDPGERRELVRMLGTLLDHHRGLLDYPA
jgi:DNA-binding MarR family transcriptional regulator